MISAFASKSDTNFLVSSQVLFPGRFQALPNLPGLLPHGGILRRGPGWPVGHLAFYLGPGSTLRLFHCLGMSLGSLGFGDEKTMGF